MYRMSTKDRNGFLVAAVALFVAAPVTNAATISWIEPAASVNSVGSDNIVDNGGTTTEAINLGESTNRLVNGVTFVGSTTRDDFIGTHKSANVYTNGGVSGAFHNLMDGFSFVGGSSADLTLTGLTAGHGYVIQLLVSDDRTAGLRSRNASFTGGASTSSTYTYGSSFSLTGAFLADATTQTVTMNAFGGSISPSPTLNGFQVREVATPQAAADVNWGSAVAVSSVGDSIVATNGQLVEAVNLGQGTDRLVNGVTFVGTATQDDFVGAHSSGLVYNDGGIGSAFEGMMDSFGFTGSTTGTATDRRITLTDLIPGGHYFVQFFVSDDRNNALRTRTQFFTGGDLVSDPTQQGFSYSITGTFLATGTTQDIFLAGTPGSGQAGGSPVVNGFQVRLLPAPEPSTIILAALGLLSLCVRRRRRL